MNLAPFKQLIRERFGLTFHGVGEEPLTRALTLRMAECEGIDDQKYFTLLTKDREEFLRLVNLLTINETYFYREALHFSLLIERLIPRLLPEKSTTGNTPINILSAGCSSGEEAYSIAIALWETFGESAPRLFSIYGVDVDSEMIARAEKAQYGSHSFRTLPLDLKKRYFQPADGNKHALIPQLARWVRFRQFNLIEPDSHLSLPKMDIVFFRNVSIYFDEQTRRSIQDTLLRMIFEKGALIVGASETLANNFGTFTLKEEDGVFYFTPPEADDKKTISLAIKPSTSKPAPRTTPPTAHATTSKNLEEKPTNDGLIWQLAKEKQYDQVLARLAESSGQNPVQIALLKAFITLERKNFDDAEAAIHEALAHDPWVSDAYVLLGLIEKWRGHPDEAMQHQRKAIYISPENWCAHYALAELYRTTENLPSATKEYHVAFRLLTTKKANDARAPVMALAFPRQQIRMLCEHRLRQLGGV